MYYYKVDCWIPPRSGYDLMKKNKALQFIESIADTLSDKKKEKFKELLKNFEDQSDGMIIKTFILESDKPVIAPKNEFLKEIKKECPQAKLSSWELLSDPVIKKID